MVPMLLSALLAMGADPTAASATAVSVDRAPIAPWSSRMIMSFTPDGTLNGCKVEASGAIEQPDPAEADCMSNTGSDLQAAGYKEFPDAITKVIFEQTFVPAQVSDAELEEPLGEELLSRQLLSVSIGKDGKVVSCRAGEAVGAEPASAQENPCELFVTDFEAPVDQSGRPVPVNGTMILSVYTRQEAMT